MALEQEFFALGSDNSTAQSSVTQSMALEQEFLALGSLNGTAPSSVTQSLEEGHFEGIRNTAIVKDQQTSAHLNKTHTHNSPTTNSPLSCLSIIINYSETRLPFQNTKALKQKHEALEAARKAAAIARHNCGETLTKAFAMGNKIRSSKAYRSENNKSANWYEKESLCELLEKVKKQTERAEKAEDKERSLRKQFVNASVKFYDEDLKGWK
jgi:uncharacterized C2H2 Zn-finger protein